MGKVQIFQLSPETKSLMHSYVIKTKNDKIIVIDGGIDGDGLEAAPYLPAAIRAIKGLSQDDPFEVEAWFLTHQHRDHFNELRKMLDAYNEDSNYIIKNIYVDFPEPVTEWGDPVKNATDLHLEFLGYLKNAINHYYEVTESDLTYDKINGAVVNAENIKNGLTIEIDGVSFDILQTWSKHDNVVNSNSMIIKLRYNEHSVLFLGDCYVDSAHRLLDTYGREALKSEYIQLAHHGQSGPDKAFYDAVDAKNSIRLWPTPDWVWTRVVDWLRTHETRMWLGLPEDAKDFVQTDRDFVQGLHKVNVSDPTLVSSWTSEVLKEQMVGEW